jgi:hypothetical protein
MIVPGQSNKQLRPIERIHRAYRDECVQFAEDYGFQADYVATWFEQLCLMHQFESKMHKNVAAWLAMRHVRAMLFKPGGEDFS